jgi:hypothetical protein
MHAVNPIDGLGDSRRTPSFSDVALVSARLPAERSAFGR